MKKLSIILLLAMLAGCYDDQVPHCARCDRRYAVNRPGRDTSYIVCDKTYDEFRAFEARENNAHPGSETDCRFRDTTKKN
ncbi:hypothetical protein [Mucilaginibacter psychrotolerans]|uniref:Lipoprotein n=1 Tax=Mucilaginibacter psychrotolerans TaxID=1524096 RepID=A0A4Y8SBK9_9SPHI|nr:hypothetical protein [Mucilaginibacter psychrotolerans]TFF35736.1 hypothetical protein E2R66_17585 [Mucilaginibacter psychrotolerans]